MDFQSTTLLLSYLSRKLLISLKAMKELHLRLSRCKRDTLLLS